LLQQTKKLNPDSSIQIKKVHDILLNSIWFGEMATKRLMEDLQRRGQLDPAVARPDGVLIDGNRRLAILRQLEENTKSSEYSTMYVCVLPDDSTEDDLKALEMRTQMTQSFTAKYGMINTALEFRHLHTELDWPIILIEEITEKYYKEKKIRDMIQTIDMIDDCLSLIPPKGKSIKQYNKLDKGWEGFANLMTIIMWAEKTDPENLEWHKKIKYFGFQIMTSVDATYADVRKLKRILRNEQSAKELELTSDTMQGNFTNFMSVTRIEEEMRNLANADQVWAEYRESPYTRAKDALKKLETITMRKQMYPDHKLLRILQKIENKINDIRRKIE